MIRELQQHVLRPAVILPSLLIISFSSGPEFRGFLELMRLVVAPFEIVGTPGYLLSRILDLQLRSLKTFEPAVEGGGFSFQHLADPEELRLGGIHFVVLADFQSPCQRRVFLEQATWNLDGCSAHLMVNYGFTLPWITAPFTYLISGVKLIIQNSSGSSKWPYSP